MPNKNLSDIQRVHWLGQSVVVEYMDGSSIVFRKNTKHAYAYLDVWQFEDPKAGRNYYYRCRLGTTSATKRDGIAVLARSWKIEGDKSFTL